MNSTKKMVVAASFLAVGSVAYAAPAQVIDLSTQQPRAEVNQGYENSSTNTARTFGTDQTSANTGASSAAVGTVSAAGGGSLFLQVQQLRDEVANLRGQLEEQAHTIGNLSRQQLELEQRLSGGAATTSASSSASAAATTTASAAATNNDGQAEYDAAYGLLKEKEYDKASMAFQNIVNQYPNSSYAGSSWFWLGFVHQTKGDMDGSAKAFSSLIEKFPTHSKADNAKYNLGKIYNQQGKTEQARSLLKEVAAGSSKEAPLAKSYLESM
ncbi:MAG: tetratricopeptide repeat protein [Pseudomonadales bacterium]